MKELENSDLEADEAGNSSDSDTCDTEEIDRLFIESQNSFEQVIAKNKYILHIAASGESDPNIALALSDHTCEVHKLNEDEVTKVTTFTEHEDKIVDCRFDNRDSNLLYTGSSDGSIKLWDVRIPKKSVINFSESTFEEGKTKSFSSFDVSSNGKLLAVGTDLFEGDAFILFWDIRNNKLMGGYWESHTDDITQVRFHRDDINKLISGSTDGLINIYDLTQTSEEDALVSSLNTESTIEQLSWFNENGKDNISCITHTSDLQLWNVDGVEPYKHLTRADISKEIKKISEDYIYLTKCHEGNDYLLILAGSNFHDGECIRGLQIQNGVVQPAFGFKENKQRVRSSWFNKHKNILLTGGEKGILNVWKIEHGCKHSLWIKK